MGRPRLDENKRSEVVNVRLTPDEKEYLVKKYGTITKALRSLLAVRTDGISEEFEEPRPRQMPPWPERAIVIGNHMSIREWEREQYENREAGQPWFDPRRAVRVRSVQDIRGLMPKPEQVFWLYGSHLLPDAPEIQFRLRQCFEINKTRRAS